MSKTIEEIKEECAKDFGFKNYGDVEACGGESMIIDEVAERYAQSQTQELQEHNDNLVNNLLEMSNSLVGLIKENDNLKDLSNTITGLQLQKQNAELVSALQSIVNLQDKYFGEKDIHKALQKKVFEIEDLLTKHNHLNKKP